MKKIIILLVVLGVATGGWFLYTKKQKEGVSIPQESSTSVPTNSGILQVREKPADSDVTKDFNIQISNGKNLILDKPVISSNYAIQTWSDENKGGQALLKYDPTRGWVLLTMGGGAWSVEDLTKLGVPKEVAVQLLK